MSGPAPSPRQRALVYLLGTALLVVSNGRWILPPATWLAPAFLLYFLEHTRRFTGSLVVLSSCMAAWMIAWWGMIPAPGIWYFVVATIYAVVAFLPFLVHRLFATGQPGFRCTLIFPATWVVTQYLFQRWVTPYGSWGALAYTQSGFSAFVQLGSVTGILGLDFMVTWFASTTAWLGSRGFRRSAFGTALSVYGVLFAMVIGYGTLRLARPPAAEEPVRIALLTPSSELDAQVDAAIALAQATGQLTQEQSELLMAKAAALNDDLLRRSRKVAEEGAEFVAWSETAARLVPSMEPALLDEAHDIARSCVATLVLGLGVWQPDQTPPLVNKVAIVRDDASPRYYQKAHPVFMTESTVIAAGPETVPIIETGDRRSAVVICHDVDHPELVRQAGRGEADLLFVPSADWPDIGQMHATMALHRAVENGLYLVRPTSGGRTMVVDPQGRMVEATTSSDNTQVIDTPVASAAAVYPVVGDAVVWLSAALLMLLPWMTRRPADQG